MLSATKVGCEVSREIRFAICVLVCSSRSSIFHTTKSRQNIIVLFGSAKYLHVLTHNPLFHKLNKPSTIPQDTPNCLLHKKQLLNTPRQLFIQNSNKNQCAFQCIQKHINVMFPYKVTKTLTSIFQPRAYRIRCEKPRQASNTRISPGVRMEALEGLPKR